MDSITQSGLASINRAFFQANESAQVLASDLSAKPAVPDTVTPISYNTPITEAMVNLALADVQSKAGVKLLQTADEVLGTLIDTKV